MNSTIDIATRRATTRRPPVTQSRLYSIAVVIAFPPRPEPDPAPIVA